MSQSKIPVGILGATGVVGQRFIQMLEHHPWFEVAWLAASDRSAGQIYGDAVRWRLKTPIPDRVRRMTVSNGAPDGAPRVIFAALDAGIARELEPQFAAAGCAVVSNSSAFRMQQNVPLIIPEVNADHLALLERQCWRRESGGYIVTNPNCSAIGLVVALAPLQRKFGIESVFVATMQAVSGAGYPGVASLDILGNVIPYIAKEEEKMEEETRKLLGRLDGDQVEQADFSMTAHCNRVAVEDGHTESVSVKLKRKAAPEEVIAAFNEFQSTPQELKLPLAPARPLVYDDAPDRPQPRFDVDRGNGMTVSVGRLRACGVLDYKFTVLSHNTIRGAAGAALLNAELLKARGLLP
ncbi:MAG TPA: aspartate-semialdehyde dehydrogenase [Candidatus Binatia bacterium]|nr:aspartate-semialdehyde dehydrogenase [Candidatus Binatia bacterium]